MTDKADLRECPFNKGHVLDRFVDGDGLKAGCKDCQIFLPIEAWQSRATPAALTQNEVEELGEAIRYVTSDDGISLTLSRGNTYQAVLKLREAARQVASGQVGGDAHGVLDALKLMTRTDLSNVGQRTLALQNAQTAIARAEATKADAPADLDFIDRAEACGGNAEGNSIQRDQAVEKYLDEKYPNWRK